MREREKAKKKTAVQKRSRSAPSATQATRQKPSALPPERNRFATFVPLKPLPQHCASKTGTDDHCHHNDATGTQRPWTEALSGHQRRPHPTVRSDCQSIAHRRTPPSRTLTLFLSATTKPYIIPPLLSARYNSSNPPSPAPSAVPRTR